MPSEALHNLSLLFRCFDVKFFAWNKSIAFDRSIPWISLFTTFIILNSVEMIDEDVVRFKLECIREIEFLVKHHDRVSFIDYLSNKLFVGHGKE